MATRRNRIKGIANIPQRRKVENKTNIDVVFESKETSAQVGGSISTEKELSVVQTIECKTDALNELISTKQELNVVKTIDNTYNGAEIVKPDVDITVENEANSDSNSLYNKNLNENSCEVNETAIKSNGTQETASSDPVIVTTCIDNEIYSEVVTLDLKCASKSNSSPNTSQDTPTSQRRTFIKPKINIKSLSQKLKPKLQGTIDIKEPPSIVTKDSEPVCNPQSDVQLLPTINNQISDSENITEPPSPTKVLNRSRIKAIPRLHQRRISATIHGSASESEDDTRKSYKRVKTDSICSTTSSICDPPAKNNPDPPPQNKDLNSIVQRKCRRSEQSYRMAEARRNFQNKFRNQTPEKQKLTMYDLIFYNPATKPMTQKQEQSDNAEDKRVDSPTNCDSPDSNVESDGDNDNVPAPQIKIGKNGEIIVDEKSLIVENKQTKINRENLKKSELVNGDFDTGYGVYKRVKRTKDWNKEDTLFFYKALHTLGTDFSLMAQLFPGRSRRELKMKFKKEDRINHALVDKALSQPLQFNIKELKQEAEDKRKQKELDELQKQKRSEELEQLHRNAIPYTCFGTKRTKESKHHKKNVKKSSQKEDIYSKLEKGIASVWNSNSEDEQVSSDSSSEVTVANIIKRTQFGRIPTKKKMAQESVEATDKPAVDKVPHKRRTKGLGVHQKRKGKELKDVQKSNDEEDNSDQLDDGVSSACNSNSEDENGSSDSSADVIVANILKQTRSGRIPNKRKVARESIDSSKNDTTDQSKELEPGSVMITCQPTSKGEPTFKVFMVTPTHTKVPIEFPSDVIDTFTRNIESTEREPSCEKTLEHNYTICHDEGGS